MRQAFAFLKKKIKSQSGLLGRLLNVNLLSKEQTAKLLASTAQELLHCAGEEVVLPAVRSLAADGKQLFPEHTIATGAACAWQYANSAGAATQLRNGSIRLGRKVLDIGLGNSVVLTDLLKQARYSRRAGRQVGLLVAPWTYYWGGYFDLMLFAMVNVSRSKAALSATDFAQATVAFPLTGATFERDILALLGVKLENIVDSRTTKVVFERCVVANVDSWFYPNRHDILAFKQQIEAALHLPASPPSRRLYMQRAGRRKVLNENALRKLLAKYDIEFIEDVPRPFAEQVQLYRDAAFVMGPHGASFANILWCQPGAQLLELFAPAYVPPYFRYLATVLELGYLAYCPEPPRGSDHSHVSDDVWVDVAELEEYFVQLFGPVPAVLAQNSAGYN